MNKTKQAAKRAASMLGRLGGLKTSRAKKISSKDNLAKAREVKAILRKKKISIDISNRLE